MLAARCFASAAFFIVAVALTSSAFAQCPPGMVQTGVREDPPVNGVVVVHPLCRRLSAPAPAVPASWTGGTLDDESAIRLIVAWANAGKKDYASGLEGKLRSFGLGVEMTIKGSEIDRIAADLTARRNDPSLAAAARSGKGPTLIAAGQQSFEDCAVFAVASAAGLPYGVVAARATGIMREAPWRTAAAQADPGAVIKKEGLYGGELLVLAEELGVAEMTRPEDFPSALAAGKPVMARLMVPGGSHQIVLSKVFSHQNATWYEVIDSNNPPTDRTYISAFELDRFIEENGVVFAHRKN